MRWRIGLSIILLALAIAFSQWPSAAQPLLELVYGDTLYPALQRGFLALPRFHGFLLADTLWLLIPLLFIVRIIWLWRDNLVRRGLITVSETLLWLAFGYFSFMLLWGLNYQREPLYQQLKADGFSQQLSSGHFAFAIQQTQKTIEQLPADFDFCASDHLAFGPLRPSALAHSAMALANLNPAPAKPVRESVWSPVYTRLGVAGVYLFPTGEPSYNSEIFTLSQPFVMTHEFAHWAGFAREYDADIISYWSLWLSPDAVWQYSAWLHWWLDIAEPQAVKQLLPAPLQESIGCYQRYTASQPRWEIRKTFWQLYETNLKTQGVSSGLKSYRLGAAVALTSYQDWLYGKSLGF